jgi:hypothetical protein
MVIDLTRRPVVVNTDVCPQWIVVRTASNGQVDGLIRRIIEVRQRRGPVKQDMLVVAVGVRRQTKDRTIMEARLPIDHVIRRHSDTPLPNPYEVATHWVDPFTESTGTWRVQISVNHVVGKGDPVWYVILRDETVGQFIAILTAKDLDASEVVIQVGNKLPRTSDELFPLERINQSSQPEPLNVWQRLRRRHEYDRSGSGSGGEEP